MAIHVRLFASFREAAGTGTVEIPYATGLTVGDIVASLRAENQLPAAAHDGSFLCAVNHEYAAAEHIVSDGDELALIPPVSGG